MKINATAYLYYNKGESVTSGWEKLSLYVKFKEDGKLFRTKLEKTLVSTFNVANGLYSYKDRIDSFDEYYKLVNEAIEDKEHLMEVAKEMIREYFKEKKEENNKNINKKDLARKINNMPKFDITVEIK